MENKFTIEEIKTYILSKDSMGDILYYLSEENINKANAYLKIIKHIEIFNKSDDKENIIDSIKEAQELGYLKDKSAEDILEIIKEWNLSDGDESLVTCFQFM